MVANKESNWRSTKHLSWSNRRPWTALYFLSMLSINNILKNHFMNHKQNIQFYIRDDNLRLTEYKILIKNASRFNGPTKPLIWVVFDFLLALKLFTYVSWNIQSCHLNIKHDIITWNMNVGNGALWFTTTNYWNTSVFLRRKSDGNECEIEKSLLWIKYDYITYPSSYEMESLSKVYIIYGVLSLPL